MTTVALFMATAGAFCVFCRTLTRCRENPDSPLISFSEFQSVTDAPRLPSRREFGLRLTRLRGIGPRGPARYPVCKIRGKGTP